MKFNGISTLHRQSAVHGLAIIGFVAVITAGVGLAVYSARYVPNVVNSLGAAAVSLSQVFTPAPAPALSVVPTASTTISFGETATATPVVTEAPAVVPATIPRVAGPETSSVIPIGGNATVPAVPSGLPDLSVRIDGVGYLASSTSDSFTATTTILSGQRPTVQFTITNVGTNATGPWTFDATIPTQTAYVYQSVPQQSLAPGDSIQYTLGFDQANYGAGQVITVIANPDHSVQESDFSNDTASTSVTILGS